MKILFKQSGQGQSSLDQFGIQNCYFKKISIVSDPKTIIKKVHHHTVFELHIVTEGSQEYWIAGVTHKLECGQFLLIGPNVPHAISAAIPNTQKYAITFEKQEELPTSCIFGAVTERFLSNLSFIAGEAALKREISHTLMENSILEILVWIFRQVGSPEKESRMPQDENAIIALAKRYIEDNIELNPSVADAAAYSYLSSKQLTRIFGKFEGITPGEYITKRRMAKIEKLILDDSLSLKDISEIMNFSNEYYFNSFFKKHAGMPPGEYRKMYGK